MPNKSVMATAGNVGNSLRSGRLPTAVPPVTAQVEAQVKAQVEVDIINALKDQSASSAEIAKALGHKKLSGNIRRALPRMREAGILEYSIPDKPNSRLQKYRLTAKGRALLG